MGLTEKLTSIIIPIALMSTAYLSNQNHNRLEEFNEISNNGRVVRILEPTFPTYLIDTNNDGIADLKTQILVSGTLGISYIKDTPSDKEKLRFKEVKEDYIRTKIPFNHLINNAVYKIQGINYQIKTKNGITFIDIGSNPEELLKI